MEFDPKAFIADPELFSALERQCAQLNCAAEQTLFQQGDPPAGVYILQDGEATLSLEGPDGHTILSIRVHPGSLLGLPAIVGGQPYSLTSVAQPGARVGFVSREDFTQLIQANPQLSFKMLQVLAAEVRTARSALR
jgi:CRP-like cAMP-binding protein